MNRITKALSDTASRMFFLSSEVTAVTEHGSHFRSIELTGDGLKNATWNLGDKVQVRTNPDGFATRTYTPISWDTIRGSTTLLAYAHGTGPGSTWVRTVTPGSPCQFFGPRRSLKLNGASRRLLFVGDETSIALISAWHRQHPDAPPLAEILEVADPDEAGPALQAAGLTSAQLFPRDNGSAHAEHLSAAVIDLLRTHTDAGLCLTGKAQTIAALRRSIKSAGITDRPILVKAYWDENRSGLD